MSRSFVTVYGSAVEGCFVTWTNNPTANKELTADFDCPFYSTTVQTAAAAALASLQVTDAGALDAFAIAFGIENNNLADTTRFAGFYVKTTITSGSTQTTLTCGTPSFAHSKPASLDKSAILTDNSGGSKVTPWNWASGSAPAAADFCKDNHVIRMFDGATAGAAISRFAFSLKRDMDGVSTGGANYDEDIDYTYSIYNTQMYMGYNDFTGATRDCSGCRYWEGDSSSSLTQVNFDLFN